MSRAVPRCVATVTIDKGDILALVARKDRIYAACAGEGAPAAACFAAAVQCRWLCHTACCRAARRGPPGSLMHAAPLPLHIKPFGPPCCTPPLHAADGSLHAWSIGKKGELSEVAVRKKAHGERVAGITLRGGLLYSVSYGE